MSSRWIWSALVGATALAAVPVYAQKAELSVTCRCVVGGANSAQAEWLKNYVGPAFEAKMAAEGKQVSVTFKEFGGSDEALKEQYALDLSVGGGADVMGFDGFWVPEFVSAGLMKPLEELGGAKVNEWEGWSHISQGLQDLMSLNGKRYGIALGTDTRMIYYRKDMLQEAGVADAANWQPTSWDEIIDAASKVKATFPDSAPLQLNAGTAMGEATTMQGWFMALLGTGEHMTDENGKWIVRSQGILDALNFYKTIYVDEQVGDARLQLLQDGRNRSFANFRDSKTALLVEGDYFYRGPTAPGQEFEVKDRDQVMGWAKMPAMAPGKGLRGQDFVTISGGTGFALNPKSKHPELAWELLAFMNSREALSEAQKTQARVRVRDDVPVPDNPFLVATASALLPLTTARPLSDVYPQVSYEAQLMTERVISGDMTPEQAMNAYADAVTQIVGKDNVVDKLK